MESLFTPNVFNQQWEGPAHTFVKQLMTEGGKYKVTVQQFIDIYLSL